MVVSKAFELELVAGKRLMVLLVTSDFMRPNAQTPQVDFVAKGWATMHVRHRETWPSERATFGPRRSLQFVISLSSWCHP